MPSSPVVPVAGWDEEDPLPTKLGTAFFFGALSCSGVDTFLSSIQNLVCHRMLNEKNSHTLNNIQLCFASMCLYHIPILDCYSFIQVE